MVHAVLSALIICGPDAGIVDIAVGIVVVAVGIAGIAVWVAMGKAPRPRL